MQEARDMRDVHEVHDTHEMQRCVDSDSAHALLVWYHDNGRDLAWRKTTDPYKILVSELMLQQTQVPRVVPKYKAFLQEFPTIQSLASADRARVLRAWQGLGYNNRAVRLHALAKLVCAQHGKTLPSSYDELRALPGIGPYTAGAIMNFSYNKHAPCVDVNIARVVTRLSFSQRSRPQKDDIALRAEKLARASKAPRDYHNAMMDLGSMICTAQAPICKMCPIAAWCKSKGARSDERRIGGVSKPQAKFRGSVRWYRGQVLKMLLRKNVSRAQLTKALRITAKLSGSSFDANKFERALFGLFKDEIIVEKDKKLVVTR